MRSIARHSLKYSVFFLLIISFAIALYGLDVPKLTGRVNDYAGMLSPQSASMLEARLSELEKTDSTQVVVLTVLSLEGEEIEDYSLRVAEKWKIGHKGMDNGAILLVSKNDRRIRIEVGYGLEGRLTDLISGRIIDGIIVPSFRAGNFDEGIVKGVDAIIASVRGEFDASQVETGRDSAPLSGLFPIFFFFLILVGIIGSIKKIFGGIAGAVIFPLTGLILFPLGLWLLLLIPLGFLAGFIMPGLASGAARGGYAGGGFGGFSSGGFSGGGFSGGGGGFGGGGASGSW